MYTQCNVYTYACMEPKPRWRAMALRPPSLPDPGGKKLDFKVGGILPIVIHGTGIFTLFTYIWLFLTVKYDKCR